MYIFRCWNVSLLKCAVYTGLIWFMLSGAVIMVFSTIYDDVKQLSTCRRRDLSITMVHYSILAFANMTGSLILITSVRRRNESGLIASLILFWLTMVFSGLLLLFVALAVLLTTHTANYKIISLSVAGLAFIAHAIICHITRVVYDAFRLEEQTEQSLKPEIGVVETGV